MIRRYNQGQNINGFTLIELLVVIAIISLLISILLPSLNKAKHLAKLTACGSNLHGIMVSTILYAEEYNGILPPNASTSHGTIDTGYMGINALYGLATLTKEDLASPTLFYGPDDEDIKYSDYSDAWSKIDQRPFFVRLSYTLREFNSTGFQQANPKAGAYVELYRVDDNVSAFISDKFTGNYVYSHHGQVGIPIEPNDKWAEGNGEGWHVAHTDGHVGFNKNNPDVYCYGNSDGAAGGWSNRHLNWLFWDKGGTE